MFALSQNASDNYRSETDEMTDDPLTLHERWIRRMTSHHPHQLIHALHHVTCLYEEDPRYKNDSRYVKIWLQYASFIKPPDVVYHWMQQKGIGEHVAIFYECVARNHVKAHRYKEANDTISLGIQKGAQPKQRLDRAQYHLEQYKSIAPLRPGLHPTSYDAASTKSSSWSNESSMVAPLVQLLDWIDAHAVRDRKQPMLKEGFQSPSPLTSFERQHVKSSRAHSPEPTEDLRPQKALRTSCPIVVHLPVSPRTCQEKLSHLVPALSTYEGFHDLSTERAKEYCHLDRLAPGHVLHLADMDYTIIRKAGQGGMATVYQVEGCAIKAETPPNVWEFYLLRQLQQRLTDTRWVINARAMYAYEDASFLLLDHMHQGTLLDVLNVQRSNGMTSLPESAAVFLTAALLEAVFAIHLAGVVHGDLKLDNVMLSFHPSPVPASYTREGWSAKGIKLIDFGRGIDLTLWPQPDIQLTAVWSPQATDPLPIRQNKTWSPYIVDYWGVAGMAHWLMFGRALDAVESNGTWCITQTIRRYWHKSLWERFFSLLLNSTHIQRDEAQCILAEWHGTLEAEGPDKNGLRSWLTLLERHIKL